MWPVTTWAGTLENIFRDEEKRYLVPKRNISPWHKESVKRLPFLFSNWPKKTPKTYWSSICKTTLPETNMAPENGWLEDVFPFGRAYFQGLR